MRVQTNIKNLTEPEKAQFESYLDEKLKRIQPVLKAHYPDADTVKVDCRIQKHERHTAFECELVVQTPKNGHFVASEVKHSITEAMDKSTDRLEQQIYKHFKKLTKE